MEEYDSNFVESLLEGSRQKSDLKVIMVSKLYLNSFCLLKNKLFISRKKSLSLHMFVIR